MPAVIGDDESPLLLRVLHGRHGLPVGILDDLAGVLHASAQRRNAGLKALVDRGQANEFLAEGRGIAQTEQHGVVVTVDLHVAGQKAAIAHDVVAVGVARGVELAFARDIPVRDGTGSLENHVGDHGGGEVLAGHVAVAGIVAVDKETRVGQADLVDHATREQAAFKAQLVHGAVALGAQVPLSDGVGDTKRKDKLVLPKEGATVEVQARTLDDIVAVGPLGKALDAFGDDEHVVVHDPKPLGAQVVGAFGAGGKAARPAAVFELRGVDDAVGAALRVGLLGVDAPQVGQAFVECGAHGLGLARILVIDDHDAPGRCRELGHGVEQVGQEFLALVRNDDDGELIDGSGKG